VTFVDPVTVDPAGLVAAMKAAGFTEFGGRPGVYVRMRWPAGAAAAGRWLMVPLDRQAGDFADLMDAAIAELALAAASGRAATAVLAAVTAAGRP
jgi:hypothetical protein